MILALPGTVIGLPAFTTHFDLSLADRGALIAALFVGLLIGSVLSGPLVDRSGYRAAIAGSTAAIAFLLPAFAFAATYPLALLALGCVGLSSAALNTAANALSSDLFPEQRGRRMNVIAVAFSVGGLLLPSAIAAASAFVSWRAAIAAGAAVSAATSLAALAATSRPRARSAAVWHTIRGFLVQPGFLQFCLLVACGAANEGTFAGWTSSYLLSSGVSPVVATWGLSSHWLGLLIGRLTFARHVDRSKPRAIVLGAVGGAVVLFVLILFPVAPVLALGPFAAGVSIAVIVPTSLALAGERHPGAAGTLFGLLLTMAQVGAMTLPPLIGAVADVLSLRVALLLAVGNGAGIAWLAWRVGSSGR